MFIIMLLIKGILKICIVQILHRNKEGICIYYILNIFSYLVLPTQLLKILRVKTIFFVGVGIGSNLAKIERDFYYTEVIRNMKNIINLGKFTYKKYNKNRVISL